MYDCLETRTQETLLNQVHIQGNVISYAVNYVYKFLFESVAV